MAKNKGITVDKIKELAEQGLTCSEIATKLGVAKTGISKRLKKYNITCITAKEKQAIKDKAICKLFKESDLSLKEISEKFNCSKSRITQILKKYEIKVPTKRKNLVRKRTVQEKYGVTNVMFSKDILEKRNKYFTSKYGVDSPFKSEEVQEKCRKTLESKYGVDNPLKNPNTLLKVRETNLKRYGGPAPICDLKIINKMYNTNLLKYGVKNIKQVNLDSNTLNLLQDKVLLKETLTKWHHMEKLTLGEIGSRLGYKGGVSYLMKELNIEVKHLVRSSFEKNIAEFVSSITNKETIYNDRQHTFELDLHIPELNLAIEADGLYYHSLNTIEDVYKKKFYHRDKTRKCIDLGIRLFHIIECEWYNNTKRSIWESVLTNAIAPKLMDKVYARKCELVEVSAKEAKIFYETNHLQGAVGATVHLGLVSQDELVSCMSFNKETLEYNWQLVRFASKLKTNVLGGASKLFKNFCRIYKVNEVSTFADLSYSYGNLYTTLGFDRTGELPPRYKYTDTNTLFHRRSFQKSKLKVMLGELYDPNLTEFQNVFNNTSYRVIFDSGKVKYIFKPTK